MKLTMSSVIEAVGPFAIWAPSGGDYAWTSRALDKGYQLVYSAEAIVRHPAQDFDALMKKATFVGTGHWKQKTSMNWSPPANHHGPGALTYPDAVANHQVAHPGPREREDAEQGAVHLGGRDAVSV